MTLEPSPSCTEEPPSYSSNSPVSTPFASNSSPLSKYVEREYEKISQEFEGIRSNPHCNGNRKALSARVLALHSLFLTQPETLKECSVTPANLATLNFNILP